MQSKTFDFEQDPFSQDYELKFVYKSSNLNLVYQQVSENIRNGEGVVVINADEGMGKTLLLHELIQNLESKVNFFSAHKRSKSFQEIVNGLCRYLTIDTDGKDFFENILALDNYLNKAESTDIRVALVVDNADQFDDVVLKKLVMLSVPPSEKRGSLQVILAGLPELETRINKIKTELPTEAQSLKTHNYPLQKLTTLQVREYINKRLQAVGSKRRNLFSPDAIANITLYSKGIPDLINKLCAATLSAVGLANKQTVTKEIVESVMQNDSSLSSLFTKKETVSPLQQSPEEIPTIEKLQLRMKHTKNEASRPEQSPERVIEPVDKSSSNLSSNGYTWGMAGMAAILLLLVGMIFYTTTDNFSDSSDSINTIANAIDNKSENKNGIHTAKLEPGTIEQSDQAMLAIQESTKQDPLRGKNKPLLMANKKNLYQKVLTLPGATLFQQPKTSQSSTIPLPDFSVYYVYLRVTDENLQGWVQVGMGRKGDLAGWIKADKVQDWNQGLTLTFKEPEDHDRVMLFKNKASLAKIAKNYDHKTYQKLYNAASQGEILKDSPVVAIQPTADIDIHENFYLLPIHDYEEIYFKEEPARLLKVSSISRQKRSGTPPDSSKISGNNQGQSGASNTYRAGITFVIDSTLSMQPFIDRTSKAVEKIYETLEQDNLLGRVNFGLVAFRDNTRAVPEIEYVTRRFSSLSQGENPQTFMSAIHNLSAAKQSSQDFIEDSYAGIYSALNSMDWTPHAARYIVLITDAGAREANDPLSFSRMDAARLNKMAREKNAAIFVMHILTTNPQANLDAAAKQYQELSNYPGIGSLYYAVPTENVQEFGKVIESLSEQISGQVAQVNTGGDKKPFVADTQNQKLAALQQKVANLGHSLEMEYLQNSRNKEIPAVFDAWVLDKDFKNPQESALEVRVLLTRDQLSDLDNILKQVLETAKQGQVSPKQFLNELKSLAATLVRDPEQLGDTTATTSGKSQSLAEMGFMREYIQDLPYTSEIMGLELENWQSWPAQKQEDFLNRLQEKVNYYQMIHDNVDMWVSLEGKSIDGDAVFPVPLAMLP